MKCIWVYTVKVLVKGFPIQRVNSVDPDEMLHYVAFHLGLHCLSKYPFYKGFTQNLLGNFA